MASSPTLCAICDLRHITKSSVVWCSECDEGLCDDCREHHSLSKATRNHNSISIAEHQKLPHYVLSIQEFCAEHNEKFQTFCKKHDRPCCRVCVVEQHNKCEELGILEDVIKDAKSCSTILEIEHLILDNLETIKQIRNIKKNNISDFVDQRKNIERQIDELRLHINNHIDSLQETLIKELTDAETMLCSEIRELLTYLDDQEKLLTDYQTNISYIKQYASDLKTFLSMKTIEHEINLQDASIQSLLQSTKMNLANITLKLDPKLESLITELTTFGNVEVNSQPCQVTVVRSKNKQDQIMSANMLSRSIDNITLKLQLTINIEADDIRGCKLLPNDKVVFSDYCNDKVIFVKGDGSIESEIKLKSCAFDIVYIADDNSVAASSGGARDMCITIMGIINRQIKQTIPMPTCVYGIVANNKNLFFCSRQNGLQMINLEDRSIKTIVKREMEMHAYIATFGESLYYTNENTNTVTCCNLEGKVQWEFKNDSCLKGASGITVDNAGNIYVVGNISNNVVVLSPDGQRHREILSYSDRLLKPQVIHFDQRTNQLLVANQKNSVFRYEVS